MIKRKLFTLLILSLSTMIVTYAYSQETWIKFQDKVGNFSILMPNKPKKDVDLLESPQGIKIKLISFISFIKNNNQFYIH